MWNQHRGDIQRRPGSDEIHHSDPRWSNCPMNPSVFSPHRVIISCSTTDHIDFLTRVNSDRDGNVSLQPIMGLSGWHRQRGEAVNQAVSRLSSQRFPGTTPVPTSLRSRTAGRRRRTWRWCEELGSPTSVTPGTTWWDGRPSPASWTSPGALSPPSAKRVSSSQLGNLLNLEWLYQFSKQKCRKWTDLRSNIDEKVSSFDTL